MGYTDGFLYCSNDTFDSMVNALKTCRDDYSSEEVTFHPEAIFTFKKDIGVFEKGDRAVFCRSDLFFVDYATVFGREAEVENECQSVKIDEFFLLKEKHRIEAEQKYGLKDLVFLHWSDAFGEMEEEPGDEYVEGVKLEL